MMIKSVHLENIRSYVDENIEFSAGSTLLSGDIGSGKSTILLAIDFCLFGLRKGELSGTDLLRNGTSRGSVELCAEIDGNDVIIQRFLKRGKENIVHDACYMSVNGNRNEYTPIELKAAILNMLGYSQELLKKNRPLFRFTVYTPQEQMKQILTSDDDRLDILRNIFGIDRYGRIRTNSRLFLTELRAMKREYDAISRNIEEDEQALESSGKSMLQLHSSAEDSKEKLASICARLETYRSALDEVKKDFASINFAKHELTKKQADRENRLERIKKIDSDLADISKKSEKLRNDMLGINEPQSADSIRDEIKKTERTRDMFLSERAIRQSDVKNLRMVYDRKQCTLCGQVVHDPDTFMRHLHEESLRLDEINAQMGNIDSELDKLKLRMNDVEKAVRLKASLDDLLRWQNGLVVEKESLEKQVSILEKDVEKLAEKTRDFDFVNREITKKEEELQAVQRERLAEEKNKSRIEQQLENVQMQIRQIEKNLLEKKLMKKKSARVSEFMNWFDPFLALTESMEKSVMAAIQKEFSEYFQKWFSILMGDLLSVRIDEQFAPVIEQNGYQTEYSNLSGGEKTSVALAYRLALNRVINIMVDSIKTKDMLILDEPTDGFSTDQLDRIRDVISELNMKQIIIVSHEPKIDTYVDNVIKIYKEGHVSRINSCS